MAAIAHLTIQSEPASIRTSVIGILQGEPSPVSPPGAQTLPRGVQTILLQASPATYHRPEWLDSEYRQAYLEASIEQGIAWQIRSNREARNMTQAELASKIGSQQSAVSRMEDPEYGGHSLGTLVKVANAFDCAIEIKFIPYSKLATDAEDLSPEALFARPFSDEKTLFGDA